MPEESPLLTLRMQAREDLLPPARRLAASVAEQVGFEADEARDVGLAVEEACRNAVLHAFDPGEAGEVEVRASLQGDRLVLAVGDRGLPFSERDLARPEGGSHALHCLMDEVHVHNLGPAGMRVDLVKHVPSRRIEHTAAPETPEEPANTPVELRLLRPEDTLALERCVYHTYGYSYAEDTLYYPDRMAERIRSGRAICAGAVTPDGEVVGYASLARATADSPTAESGQAMVDPRFRGHHIFEGLKGLLAEEARRRGLLGIYSESVTLHPFTQRANLKLGAAEIGMVPAYVPTKLHFKWIPGGEQTERQAVMLYYMRVHPEPPRILHAPPQHRDMLEALVRANGLDRTFSDDPVPPAGPARVSSFLRPGWGIGVLKVEQWGEDAAAQAASHRDSMVREGMDVILCDLPLQDPATPAGCETLEALGFSFAGLMPEQEAGDVLRLVSLNRVGLHADRIVTESALGARIKEYVLERLAHA